MFSLDDQARGLEAAREQVAALFQSINAPHVVVPGRRAGPAQAFIACLRGTHGFSVGVYLWLSETKECAVYTTAATAQTPEEYRALQTEALGFVESMGFMMD
ncbi:MAG TPA: social motility and stimulation tgl protein, partial [Myxococcaceae bacterium]